jgi:5-methylthioribose kinase
MVEIEETTAPAYALERGLFPAGAKIRAEWLSGGVSNVVLRLTDSVSGRELILKQARERLRVQADWRSRLDRIWREVLVLRTIVAIFPERTVPAVLDEDRENYAFAMTAAPRDHIVWKAELLDGRLRPGLLPELGGFLSRVHALSSSGDVLPSELRDKQVFDELRLDPYYRWTAGRHPEVARALDRLIAETEARAEGLTLADFSPKNILLWDDRFTVIDFETAHIGDPAFDLGFCLTHLVLKCLHLATLREALLDGIHAFWAAYRAGLPPALAAAIEQRSMVHLAACLLARVDGKSPVDYLNDGERQWVRQFAIAALNDGSPDWADFESRLRKSFPSVTACIAST